MDFSSFISWAVSQPWSFAVPFAAAVLADWGLGSFEAWRAGTFNKERVFDWLKTTVGWKQAVAVGSSVASAYFLNGKDAGVMALIVLISINGSAFLVVLSDIKQKIADLISPPAPVMLPKGQNKVYSRNW